MAADESTGGSVMPGSESLADALACGGVCRREDRRVEARRSLADAKVPPGGWIRSRRTWWWGRRLEME